MNITPIARLLAGLALATGSLAQPAANDSVYRCGPDGRSYSATPCPEGRPVMASDPRDASQQHQASAIAQRERALADKLAAERVRRERATVPAGAINLTPRASDRAASAPAKGKPRKPKKDKSRKDRKPAP